MQNVLDRNALVAYDQSRFAHGALRAYSGTEVPNDCRLGHLPVAARRAPSA